MSHRTSSYLTASRSSSQVRNELLHGDKPFRPWCLLLSESTVPVYQVPLMDPDECSKELVRTSFPLNLKSIPLHKISDQQHRLAHVWGQRGRSLNLKTPSNIFYRMSSFGSRSIPLILSTSVS